MKKRPKCDFSGWATRNNLKCADGRTIIKDAFKECDGTTVPLVWNHQHNDPSCVLGHALLENRDEGVYAYGFLNDTETAAIAKALLQHGDIKQMSIYANQLTQDSRMNVMHGIIREVSLVHASANPGAWIDTVIAHSDDHDEEAVIYTGEELELIHSADNSNEKENEEMKIKVNGMMCGHCEMHVKKALEAIEGIESVVASHEENLVTITNSKDIDEAAIKAAVEEAGYEYAGVLE